MFLSPPLATAISVALFSGAVGAIRCYKQPGKMGIYLLPTRDMDMEASRNKWETGLCVAPRPDRCVVARKCSVKLGNLDPMEDQDIRGCANAEEDYCNQNISGYNGNTANEACREGCRVCDTDLCNGIAGGGKFGIIGTPPIAMLIGTISMGVGTVLKMWMI